MENKKKTIKTNQKACHLQKCNDSSQIRILQEKRPDRKEDPRLSVWVVKGI